MTRLIVGYAGVLLFIVGTQAAARHFLPADTLLYAGCIIGSIVGSCTVLLGQQHRARRPLTS